MIYLVKLNRGFTLCLLMWVSTFSCYANTTLPKLQHANNYQPSQHQNIAITDYFVSEKLDGIRGYWNGEKLLSRNGLLISAPAWFTKDFPKQALDGELWLARGEFQQTLSIVSQLGSSPSNDVRWQDIRFMIFDLPSHPGDFRQRVAQMKLIVEQVNSPYLRMIKQQRLQSQQQLQSMLAKMVKSGGEGLMLHHSDALYTVGKTSNILKLKPHFDAEAKVVGHLPGQGKYIGMLGSLLVENIDGIRFKVGTGFTDEQRRNPPKVGSVITYKYWGLTKSKVPRFASFLRMRKSF